MKIKKPFFSWSLPIEVSYGARWIATLQDPAMWAVIALIIYLLLGGTL